LTQSPAVTDALTFTGERFTPEVRGAIGYEHWHRYCAVRAIARGARVLDAACGEGYGSALIAQTALHVTGIDADAATIAHARARYDAPNVTYIAASVTALPLADESIDLVVSFETIEHLAAQREMLAEFRRVLKPSGVLAISSPNRPVYNAAGAVENEYHVKELDRSELKSLLDERFPAQAWYAQRILAHSVLWSQEVAQGPVAYETTIADVDVRREPAPPMYFVVLCAASGDVLPTLPALSLFDDGELSLWRDYARASLRERELAWDELDARKVAEDRLAELVIAVNALASERQKSDALSLRASAVDAELAAARAQLANEASAHAETRARLAYRQSLAGWLRWPLAEARRRLAGASADRP
jgi:2-polyprenyl-3-methyl-5-hydroxy-6-metoxy-1,4-benzoquinol methylase